jgi:hypothetical protein
MNPNFWQRTGLTPGKAVLIGGLGALLIGVFGYQFLTGAYGGAAPPAKTGQETAIEAESAPRRRGDVVATTTTGFTAAASDSEISTAEWPSYELAEILAHNPFTTPAVLTPAPKVAAKGDEDLIPFSAAESQLETTTDEVDPEMLAEHRKRVQAIRALIDGGATMVMSAADGSRVAVVNGSTFRIGDTIHGMRVTAINSDGVVLETISDDQ